MARNTHRRLLPRLAAGLALASMALTLLPMHADADGFRRRLAVPSEKALPQGAERVERLQPLPRELIERAVRQFFAAYSNDRARMNEMLGDIYDRERILDGLGTRIPPDAKLRVMGVEAVQIVQQYIETDAGSGQRVRVSRVAVTVRGELTYNSRQYGFVRREGRSEYLLYVNQLVRRGSK